MQKENFLIACEVIYHLSTMECHDMAWGDEKQENMSDLGIQHCNIMKYCFSFPTIMYSIATSESVLANLTILLTHLLHNRGSCISSCPTAIARLAPLVDQ